MGFKIRRLTVFSYCKGFVFNQNDLVPIMNENERARAGDCLNSFVSTGDNLSIIHTQQQK